MNYISQSETPDGMVFIDARVNNTITTKFEGGESVYPLPSTARHLLNVLFEAHYRNVNMTWEVHV